MIDPTHSLAFSIQANRGVYALLLGSGVSRTAKIPTGWEVTLDLVRKLATITNENCDPSPEQWYQKRFGREPDYSEVLAEIAKTQAERQQLLRSYWEPTEQEREEGAKQPTAAHKAIAALVEQGFIKVIITTNFDRLMETALTEVGITPIVLSTPDHIAGALPLIHTSCCIIKVHGDYLDSRILNTPQELSAYPPEFDKLLDRVFDEFGLVICGWSADWDEALRRAMLRAPSRRFSSYWAVVGEPSPSAQELIRHRAVEVIPITGADQFFQTMHQQVQSLQEFSRPHPLSTEAAVASLKRYLGEPKFRIKLTDLVLNEVDKVTFSIESKKILVSDPVPNTTTATERIRTYEALCSTLTPMAVVGGQWADNEHVSLWQRALQRLSVTQQAGGMSYVLWAGLQRYPATLLLYSLGMSAIEAGRFMFLGQLFATPLHQEYQDDIAAVQALAPYGGLFDDGRVACTLQGMENKKYPLSEWLFTYLRPHFRQLLPTDINYQMIFDHLEILIGLAFGSRKQGLMGYWASPGCFNYRTDTRTRILKQIEDSISRLGDHSPYVSSNLFGDTSEVCRTQIDEFKNFMVSIRRY